MSNFIKRWLDKDAECYKKSVNSAIAHHRRRIDAEIAVGQIPTEMQALKSEMQEIKLLLEQITRGK